LNFINKEILGLNSSELNPLDHNTWENIRGHSHVSFKTEDRRTHGLDAANDSLTQSTIDRAVKEFLND